MVSPIDHAGRPVKIFLIAEFGAFGGTRTYFELLLRFYAASGFDVVVAVPESQSGDALRGLLRECGAERIRLAERYRWGSLGSKFPFSVGFDLWSAGRAILRHRPDVVVISAALPGNYLGLVLLPVSFLYIVHTVPVQTSRSGTEKLLMRFARRPRKRLLTVSHYAKAQIARWWGGGNARSIEVLHNSVEILPSRGPGSFDKKPRVVRVLTVGHLASYKNPWGWVRIAEQVIGKARCPVEFVWVGDGELRGECEAAAERSPGSIRFVGFRADVDSFYATSHVYLQPSLMESHGLSVVEAMRWSLPSVVAATGGLPESVSDGVNGFVVESHDEAAFADRLLRLVHDAQLRRRMGAEAHRLCAERFDQRHWTRAMYRLHTEISFTAPLSSAKLPRYEGKAS